MLSICRKLWNPQQGEAPDNRLIRKSFPESFLQFFGGILRPDRILKKAFFKELRMKNVAFEESLLNLDLFEKFSDKWHTLWLCFFLQRLWKRCGAMINWFTLHFPHPTSKNTLVFYPVIHCACIRLCKFNTATGVSWQTQCQNITPNTNAENEGNDTCIRCIENTGIRCMLSSLSKNIMKHQPATCFERTDMPDSHHTCVLTIAFAPGLPGMKQDNRYMCITKALLAQCLFWTSRHRELSSWKGGGICNI